MHYRTLFPHSLFSEFDRLQREVQQSYGLAPSIRGLARGSFPALNVGNAAQSIEIYAFAPGIDPASLEVQIERFSGRFRRVLTLPDDVDPDAVQARYRDGVLHVSIPRRSAAQARRIAIQ